MRNLKLIDAVVALHDIARTVEQEVGHGQLSDDIRKCADRLHELSISEREYAIRANDAINKAKNDIQ
jgi:hypothetical protein